MSEKIIQPEHQKSHESTDHSAHNERLNKHHESAAEKAKKEQSEVNLSKLREQAKAHAEKADKIATEKQPDEEPQTILGTQRMLKANAYEQTLKRVQHKLSKPNRALSKVVHNKSVEAVSNVGAATIARPSGILGGSICAFLGSLILLYSSKHYGFRYNYLLFFLLFIAGFMIGSLIELLIWTTYTRKKHY
jgi:hypothetical protein